MSYCLDMCLSATSSCFLTTWCFVVAGGPGYRQPFGDEESYKLLYTQSVLLLQWETSGGELWGNVVGLHQTCNLINI